MIVIIVVAVLAVLAIIGAIVGPTKKSDTADTTSTTATTTTSAPETTVAEMSTTPPTTSAPPETAAPTTAAPSGDAATVAALQAWLGENYAGTSWLPAITGFSIQSSRVWITTNMYKDADATAPAKGICGAVSAWIINHPESGLKGLRVAAVDGQQLALRATVQPSDPC